MIILVNNHFELARGDQLAQQSVPAANRNLAGGELPGGKLIPFSSPIAYLVIRRTIHSLLDRWQAGPSIFQSSRSFQSFGNSSGLTNLVLYCST